VDEVATVAVTDLGVMIAVDSEAQIEGIEVNVVVVTVGAQIGATVVVEAAVGIVVAAAQVTVDPVLVIAVVRIVTTAAAEGDTIALPTRPGQVTAVQGITIITQIFWSH